MYWPGPEFDFVDIEDEIPDIGTVLFFTKPRRALTPKRKKFSRPRYTLTPSQR